MQRDIIPVNGSDRSWMKHRFILAFGAYADTRIMVWANHIEGAIDEAIDWLVDHAPGHIVDDLVAEAYREAIAAGKSEEEAMDYAREDTTCGGNAGNYIMSHEWYLLAEDPSRAELLALMGRT